MWGVWENSLPDKFTEYVWNDLDPYLLPPFEKTEEKKVVVPATSIPVFYGKIEYGDSSSCKGIFGVDLREKECVEYEVEPLRDMSEKGRKKAKKVPRLHIKPNSISRDSGCRQWGDGKLPFSIFGWDLREAEYV